MNRQRLARDEAMLIVFPEADYHEIWMWNMRFSLDLVWISNQREVIGVRTVSPCSALPCPIYRPPGPAKYVLEVAPGSFNRSIGDLVTGLF